MSKKLKIEIDRLREDIQSSDIIQVKPYINGFVNVSNPKWHLQAHVNEIERLINQTQPTSKEVEEALLCNDSYRIPGHHVFTREQFITIKQVLTVSDDPKEVYIIMSPGGGIGLDISTSKGKCYTDLIEAEKELKSKNEWSKIKGYGTYELVTLEVVK